MDFTLLIAFASFAAMIGAWIALPTTGMKEAETVTSTTAAASPSKA